VIGALRQAGQACLSGELAGVVTGPVHKAVINEGGIAYSGTTELLADQARTPVVMMLANEIVRVALATTHLPLRSVADAITADGLALTLQIVH
ncbi:4-hydroxythreonine-4-phosphate dehydrogenase PdxA, partial [Streptococcus suis]